MKKFFWVYLILTLSIMVGIFCFSAQPGEESSAISEGVTKKVVVEERGVDIPKNEYDDKFEFVETIIRKSAHFLIFTALGFCVFMTLYSSGKMNKNSVLCIISLLICIIYASTDEIHQLFVSERSGELRDVLIDSGGSFVGIFIALILQKIRKKPKNNKV